MFTTNGENMIDNNTDIYIMRESSWNDAWQEACFDLPISENCDKIEILWGLIFKGHVNDDDSCGLLEYFVVDKDKFLLAKIKYGF
jgi:hypothetical protein